MGTQYETIRCILYGDYPIVTRISFTNTYIVSLSYFDGPIGLEQPTIIQVFTLPPDGSSVENGKRVLCLTHEGVMEDFLAVNVEVLKPLMDPITGATHLRLLDYSNNRTRDFRVTRIDLTLPEPRADDVSPVTVEMRHHRLWKEVPTRLHKLRFLYVDVSEEGHVRGFCGWRFDSWGAHCENNLHHIMKFTIDTRQDEWVIDCGKLSPVEWSHLGDTGLEESIIFDGMRGKICSVALTNRKNILVVDIE